LCPEMVAWRAEPGSSLAVHRRVYGVDRAGVLVGAAAIHRLSPVILGVQTILAEPTVEIITSPPSHEGVITVIALQVVIASAAGWFVVALPSNEGVIAGIALQVVVAAVAE
jgi:hypothetical protein